MSDSNPIASIEKEISEERIFFFDQGEFSCPEKISDSAHSSVCKLDWKSSGIAVVLKKIKVNKNPRELLLLHKVALHPNIIGFYGLIKAIINFSIVSLKETSLTFTVQP
ncbi:9548_t:CDS:2 [Dentiscutata heterogama]|uniref:9548_t:CDS:1 n=1 Tax=Dentiscutata heterogama TaxID=1316150 RepID=A0ACA9K8L6_9GLOM|nr:9548_t:CDS:2 [Dentiscutata heterogama]